MKKNRDSSFYFGEGDYPDQDDWIGDDPRDDDWVDHDAVPIHKKRNKRIKST
jgi:hypothetical protein